MGSVEYIKVEIAISRNLFDAVNNLIYEMDGDIKEKTFNEFVINAIVSKFNRVNKITSGKIGKDGFTDGKSFTEHYLK